MLWVTLSKIIKKGKRLRWRKGLSISSGSPPDPGTNESVLDHIPKSEAHSCLFVPELLICIFEHLPRQSILSASLVCKAWCKLAVAASWSVHPVSMKQLLRVIRAIQYSNEPEDDFAPVAPIPLDVTLDEWNRFLYGFNRIKYVRDGHIWGDKGLWTGLEDLLLVYGGCLSGNFQEISGCNGTELDSNIPPGIVFPYSLRSVEISQVIKRYEKKINPSKKLDTYLTRLALAAPHVEEIRITAQSLTFSSFDSFPRLSAFRHSGSISLAALQSVFQCPNLRCLSITNSTIPRGETDIWLDQSSFIQSTVEELEIRLLRDDGNISVADDLLFRKLSLPLLMKLSVCNRRKDANKTLSLLQSLSMRSPEVREVSLGLSPITNLTLSCLGGFRGLRKLKITQGHKTHFMIDEVELGQWLEGMPLLEIVEWMTPAWQGDEHILKLSSVVCFAYHSPLLEELSISLDLTKLHARMEGLRSTIAAQAADPFPALCTLSLKVFNLSPFDTLRLAKTLVKLTPDTTQLKVLVRTGRRSWKTWHWNSAIADGDTKSMENKFPSLIDYYRRNL